MAEISLERQIIYTVVEVGFMGREITYGSFTTEQEAWERQRAVLADHPELRTPGVLQIQSRSVEVLHTAAPMGPVGKETAR